MILLIPVDEKNLEEAKIVTFNKRAVWMVVEMEQGFVKKQIFVDSKEDVDDYIDYVIVKSKDENIEEFLDEGIEVLIAPLQRYVEDVIEAYKFRELHEL